MTSSLSISPVEPFSHIITAKSSINEIQEYLEEIFQIIKTDQIALTQNNSNKDNNNDNNSDINDDENISLTKSSIKCCYILLFGYSPSSLELSRLKFPMNKQTFFTHFISCIKQFSPSQIYQAIFNSFDLQLKGFIRYQDFINVIHHSCHVNMSEEICQELFSVADVDKDGIISYREFEALMTGKLLRQYEQL